MSSLGSITETGESRVYIMVWFSRGMHAHTHTHTHVRAKQTVVWPVSLCARPSIWFRIGWDGMLKHLRPCFLHLTSTDGSSRWDHSPPAALSYGPGGVGPGGVGPGGAKDSSRIRLSGVFGAYFQDSHLPLSHFLIQMLVWRRLKTSARQANPSALWDT